MKPRNKIFMALGILVSSLCLVGVVVYVIPIVIDIYTSLQGYSRRVDEFSDYTKFTTPLPRSVVNDICSKFEINRNDARCQPDSVVYGPDFFKDIVSYINGLPKQESALDIVQDKLGTYLVGCERKNNEGSYRCRYDLRGDDSYPIFIYFDRDGRVKRIIAHTNLIDS